MVPAERIVPDLWKSVGLAQIDFSTSTDKISRFRVSCLWGLGPAIIKPLFARELLFWILVWRSLPR